MRLFTGTPLARIALVGLAFAAGVGCAGNVTTRTVTEAQFRKMRPFQGQVTAIERLEWPEDFAPTSMSGPHYRVTVVRKDDGSKLIIDRVQTSLLSNETVVLNLSYAEATYPDDLFKSKREWPTTAP